VDHLQGAAPQGRPAQLHEIRKENSRPIVNSSARPDLGQHRHGLQVADELEPVGAGQEAREEVALDGRQLERWHRKSTTAGEPVM
jgi:hypothetical protein